MRRRPAIALIVAGVAILGVAAESAGQPSGGFGGVGGGGPFPTGGSSWGYNRAGTASGGGFAYGDGTRFPSETVVVPGGPAPAGLPCAGPAVTVRDVQYYKCGSTWYTAALTSGGISYVKVAPPPGN